MKGNRSLLIIVGLRAQAEKQQRSDVQLSERLASLGIMGDQLRAPLKPPLHHCTTVLSGLKGVF